MLNGRRIAARVRYAVPGLVIGGALAWGLTAPHHPAATADHWGDLVEQDARPVGATSRPLDVRTGCRISAFGVYPWLPRGATKGVAWEGATRAALTQMGMPAEAVALAMLRLRAGTADEAIGVANTHGMGASSGALYLPLFDTTYRSGERYTICRDTATRFSNDDRQEFAVLYRVPDGAGRVWHVGEFLSCGNVTLFQPAPNGWAPPIAPPARQEGSMAHGKPPGGGVGRLAPNEAPEPGSALLMLLGLAVVAGIRRRRGAAC